MKLEFDLIPTSAWGKNIRNALGRSKWDKLRKRVLEEQGNVCATCGATAKLQCHEVWEFDDKDGVQSLTGFQASCSLCHLGSHFGLAKKLAQQGHADIDDVISNFLKVNEITVKDFKEELDKAITIFNKRCEIEWKQDFGEWAGLLENS